MSTQSILYFLDDLLKKSPLKLIDLNLNLSKNKINNKLFLQLGNKLIKFPKLEKLALNFNSNYFACSEQDGIGELISLLKELKQLWMFSLDISQNCISPLGLRKIIKELLEMQNLQVLKIYLRDNILGWAAGELLNELTKLTNLRELTVDLSETHFQLNEIDGNQIENQFAFEVFENLEVLELNLGNNFLGEKCIEFVGAIVKIRTLNTLSLNLENNNIEFLNVVFSPLTNISNLVKLKCELRQNKISKIFTFINQISFNKYVVSLEIDLEDCECKQIQNQIGKFKVGQNFALPLQKMNYLTHLNINLSQEQIQSYSLNKYKICSQFLNILKLNAKQRFIFIMLSLALKQFSYYLFDSSQENASINLTEDILLLYI